MAMHINDKRLPWDYLYKELAEKQMCYCFLDLIIVKFICQMWRSERQREHSTKTWKTWRNLYHFPHYKCSYITNDKCVCTANLKLNYEPNNPSS